MTADNPWTAPPVDDYGDLDSFDSGYRPEHQFKAGIDTLPDGDYDFEIQSATFGRAGPERVLRIILRGLNGSPSVEWTHWLIRQEAVNGLCADLILLGFDAAHWGSAFGRPLSTELPRAVQRLPGIKFRGHKSSREDSRPTHKGKLYHDLRVVGRTTGRPMPAPPPASVPPAPVPMPVVSDEMPDYSSSSSDEVPF